MEDSLADPHKVKYRITVWASNSASAYIPQIAEDRYSNKYLYTDVHGSTICSSQKVETTHMSLSGWMDEQNVIYPYDGVFFSHKRE